jgi:hypothetical protein
LAVALADAGAFLAGAAGAAGLLEGAGFFVATAVFTGAALAGAAGAAFALAGTAEGLAAGLTVLAVLADAVVPALALLVLALVAFTSCLLTETRWSGIRVSVSPARDAGRLPAPSARECTGLAMGIPIICKSATNIRHPEKKRRI